MADIKVTFETDEQLRDLLTYCLSKNANIPELLIWCKVSKTKFKANCPLKVRGQDKPMKDQFYGDEIDEDVYVPLARNRKTGNFRPNEITTEKLSAWVEEFGIESMCIKKPDIEEVI